MRKETTSRRMFRRAEKLLVGGVDSPVRSFRGVNREYPLFISRARGSKIWDVDGNVFIDYVCSWGASILGSAHPNVVRAVRESSRRGLSFGAATDGESDLAEKIKKNISSIELLRLVSSGTEATMSAVRVARAYSKKDKILKFDGCYHGHGDSFLVRAGSGLSTLSIPDSAGIPDSISKETLSATFNDTNSVVELLESNRGKVAAIIVEPVAGNMGVVPPKKGFLGSLRKLADEHEALLIFDEVITGFRVAIGGAQSLFNVKPDLTCLGKVIGGGMNVACYGGRSDIMKRVAPLGPVYQAGTLTGNPVAVAAGLATLEQLRPSIYSKLERASSNLSKGLAGQYNGVGLVVQRVGSMIGVFFHPASHSIENYADVNQCDRKAYANFFDSMLESGMYLPPSAFETIFVSAAHSDRDIDLTISSSRKALELLN